MYNNIRLITQDSCYVIEAIKGRRKKKKLHYRQSIHEIQIRFWRKRKKNSNIGVRRKNISHIILTDARVIYKYIIIYPVDNNNNLWIARASLPLLMSVINFIRIKKKGVQKSSTIKSFEFTKQKKKKNRIHLNIY